MSDNYQLIGMSIVGIVVVGIAGVAVSLGFTNSVSESGNNSSGEVQADEPWENIYSNKSDANLETPEELDNDADNNPMMDFEGGSRKRKPKSKKHNKRKKTRRKHKRRGKQTK